MNNIVIKNINDITPFDADASLSQGEKENLVNRFINPRKYRLQGFLNRTNEAVLEARYHTVRDKCGRFARVR